MASRICSECSTPLTGMGPQAKTCGPAHRSARSRRLKRLKKEAGEAQGHTPAAQEIAARVRGEVRDVLPKVIEEEVRPVVRESITEDTLRAIAQMVGLTSAAVAAIADDLGSDDATIRQRAYSLVMKYTVGHGAIVTPIEQDKTQPINVHFQLPRPPAIEGEATLEEEPPEPGEIAEATVVKTCDTCGKEGTLDEFAAASTRCKDCYAKQKARAAALLKDYAGD